MQENCCHVEYALAQRRTSSELPLTEEPAALLEATPAEHLLLSRPVVIRTGISMARIPDVTVLSINFGCMWLHSQPKFTLLTAWTREACSDADPTSLPVSKMVMSPPMAFAALTALKTSGPTWSPFGCATTNVDIYNFET